MTSIKFPAKTLCVLLIFFMRSTYLAHLIFPHFIALIILIEEYEL
jgi:hypothetical protein